MKENNTRQPISPILKALSIGESVEYPMERLDVVKVTANLLGIKLGRIYSTSIRRDSRTILVTRLQ